MTRQEILEYVRNNANDVADLTKVHLIETTADSRLAAIETRQLITIFGDEYETAQRSADFDEIFGTDWVQ